MHRYEQVLVYMLLNQRRLPPLDGGPCLRRGLVYILFNPR